MRHSILSGALLVSVLLAGCVETREAGTASPPVSTGEDSALKEAVAQRWEEYCAAGYCEGYEGRIVAWHDDYVTVRINGNTRYLEYRVDGEPGDYTVYMWQTPNQGRVKP